MGLQGLRRLGALVVAAALAVAGSAASAGQATLVVEGGSGRVLSEVNPDQQNHPASLTKVMTLYLAFEAIEAGRLRWDQKLPVSRNAASKIPTKLGLVRGGTVTVREAVLGMIVHSANDAATAVGEALAGGSEAAFARAMTAKARALGMTHTTFRDASGLTDEGQLTTARDMATLAMAIHRDFPQHYKLFATRAFKFRGHTINGHNRLMYRYAGMDGLKTGYTGAAGWNLISSAERGGRRLFGVVLGGRTAAQRNQQMASILDAAFQAEAGATLVATAAPTKNPIAKLAAKVSPISEAHAETIGDAADGGWSLQVGAFGGAAQARQAAQKAARLAGLGDRPILVLASSKPRRLYRAVVGGLASSGEARAACDRLKREDHDCLALPPSS